MQKNIIIHEPPAVQESFRRRPGYPGGRRHGGTIRRRTWYPALFCLMLAANAASAGVWKFAVVGDSRGDGAATSTAWVNTNVLQAVARGITNDRADFVLLAGDMIFGSNAPACTNLIAQYAIWSNAFSPVYTAKIPVYPIRGNHETYGDSNGNIYTSFFGAAVPANGPAGEVGLTYSFTHSNAFFVGLDQYQNPHRVNQSWLDSQLAAHSERLASNRFPHVFVFGHEPAVQVSHSDCLAYENTSRDLFLKSITEAGSRMYFCGHDHFYNRGRLIPKNGINIMQVVLGTCGAPYRTWDGIYGRDYGEGNMASNCYYSAYTNGYVLVTVSNFNVRLEWKGSTNLTTWTPYDSYCYQMTNPALRNVNDYDGDSRADLAVYSESQGEMIVAKSASNYASFISLIGGRGAAIAPGDYDGDGLADLAVYWKESGLWQILLSDHNYAIATNTLGGTGYIPVPADYDGDGKTDLAAYQKSSGNWQIIFSSNSISISGAWGGPGYQAAPGDYDGDGRADIVVYHEQTGVWALLLSAGLELGHYAYYSLPWGGPGYFAVPADYDNDGRSDPALFDKSEGLLLAALSGSGYQTAGVIFNTTNGASVIGDYDGDRKTDPMVYLQPEADWLVALSTLGYQLNAVIFGGPDWTPVQNNTISHNLVFLAFGDSITYGSGTSANGPATAYPKLLETKLKENYAGYFLSINAGNPGETTEEGLERYASVLSINNPDLVLIMEGTNDEFEGDPYDQTEDNLRAMVQIALARGINVIIATIPPVISNSYYDRREQQARIVEFNPRIYQIAADYNIPVAPVFNAITSVPNWQNDLMDQPSANHPNDAGHAVIRDTFYTPVSAELENGDYY